MCDARCEAGKLRMVAARVPLTQPETGGRRTEKDPFSWHRHDYGAVAIHPRMLFG
jgi:hypothetical protein